MRSTECPSSYTLLTSAAELTAGKAPRRIALGSYYAECHYST